MKLSFWMNFRQGFRNRMFLVGVLVVPLILMASQLDVLAAALRLEGGLPKGFGFQLLQQGLDSKSFGFVLPVLCTLPASAGFVEERKSGAVKLFLHRMGYRNYLLGKLGACALCGGLQVGIGCCLSLAAAVFSLFFVENEAAGMETLREMLAHTMPSIILYGMSGCLWAAVGMCVSSISCSKYVAYLSPFIGYYLLIILHERYFPSLVILNPKVWVRAASGFPLGFWGNLFWLLELLLLTAVLFVWFGGRRLRNV